MSQAPKKLEGEDSGDSAERGPPTFDIPEPANLSWHNVGCTVKDQSSMQAKLVSPYLACPANVDLRDGQLLSSSTCRAAETREQYPACQH